MAENLRPVFLAWINYVNGAAIPADFDFSEGARAGCPAIVAPDYRAAILRCRRQREPVGVKRHSNVNPLAGKLAAVEHEAIAAARCRDQHESARKHAQFSRPVHRTT